MIMQNEQEQGVNTLTEAEKERIAFLSGEVIVHKQEFDPDAINKSRTTIRARVGESDVAVFLTNDFQVGQSDGKRTEMVETKIGCAQFSPLTGQTQRITTELEYINDTPAEADAIIIVEEVRDRLQAGEPWDDIVEAFSSDY